MNVCVYVSVHPRLYIFERFAFYLPKYKSINKLYYYYHYYYYYVSLTDHLNHSQGNIN